MADAILQDRAEKGRAACREYYQRNKDRLRELAKARAAKLRKENPSLAKLRSKTSKDKKPDKYKTAHRKYYEKNKSKVIERAALNDKKYPDQRRARTAKRRALKAMAGGSYSKHDISRLMIEQVHLCNGCGCDISEKFEVDHIVPISRGGSNFPENIQLLCRPCNARKWAYTMEEWTKRKKQND